MVRRNYGFGRLKGPKRFRRIRIEDLVLLLLPLIFMLVFLPPPKSAKPTGKEGQEVQITTGSAIKIIVYNPNESLVDEYPLEDYVVGVVAAEMPPGFDMEALKAQAVAARTFALSRVKGLYSSYIKHFGAHVCTDPAHCQAWISKKRFLEVYGNEKDWEKVQKAVKDTAGVVMTYNGTLINPLFHSNSGGVTEDIEAVWSSTGKVPYLKSVYSPGEDKYPEFQKKVRLNWDELKKKVKAKYPKAKIGSTPKKELEVVSYTQSGRVDEIRIGSVTMTGPEFRELLALRSTNLDFGFPDKKTVEIISKGYGHGVGMSQCGADAMAKKGTNYIKILEYYYTGVKVEEIHQ
ncbi:MAG: stage II sporulation protein D [Clostridia bacterium]|nr:stage II sporulation protein D [Clostridia bacterium]